MKSPYFVGSFAFATHSTNFSCSFLYRLICAIVQIFKSCSSANASRSSLLAIVPSSFMISQQRPTFLSPAISIRSTVTSVCPGRSKIPPFLATSGNICPGLLKSSGFAPSSTTFMAVMERSKAEIPVVVSL